MASKKAGSAPDKTASRTPIQRVILGPFKRMKKPMQGEDRQRRSNDVPEKQDKQPEIIDLTSSGTINQQDGATASPPCRSQLNSSVSSSRQSSQPTSKGRPSKNAVRDKEHSVPASNGKNKTASRKKTRTMTDPQVQKELSSISAPARSGSRVVTNTQVQRLLSSMRPRPNRSDGAPVPAPVPQDSKPTPQTDPKSRHSSRKRKTFHFADLTTDQVPVYQELTEDEAREKSRLPARKKVKIDLLEDTQGNEGTGKTSQAQVTQPNTGLNGSTNSTNAAADLDIECLRNNVAIQQLRSNVRHQRQTLESALENPQLSQLSQGHRGEVSLLLTEQIWEIPERID